MFFCFFSFLLGDINNAIIAIVEKEPITKYELEQIKKQGLKEKEAMDILIDQKLKKSQIKKFGLYVNDYELNSELNNFLKQNNMDINALKTKLKKENIKYESFLEDLKNNILTQKLYQIINSSLQIDQSEEGARQYYNKNLEQFSIYTNIELIKYSSNDKDVLEKFLKDKIKNNKIKENKNSINARDDIKLVVFLSRIKDGEFSPMIEENNEFVSYLVITKQNPQYFLFEQIKQDAMAIYANYQRENLFKDYFDKLKVSARIDYIK